MSLRVFACAASAALLSLLAPAAAQDRGETEPAIRLAQDEGPMVITPRPYSGDPGSYPQGSYAPPQSNSYSPQANYDGAAPPPPANGASTDGDTFSAEEIMTTGHRFFGRVSMEFAQVVEHAYRRSGRPNGYILGEEAGGAFVAGLRYGEGTLYTKDAGNHKVYWQGPSLGYDFGAEGSKTMVLVYHLQSPGEIYATYPGLGGSAYFIGGVGITFLARDHVTLAPIRSGVGLRLGANVGYLKYTREPTWNPF
ncbi:MAG: DUF1134 domain-containing protein [Methyloceanibacter sp.]